MAVDLQSQYPSIPPTSTFLTGTSHIMITGIFGNQGQTWKAGKEEGVYVRLKVAEATAG